MDFTKKEAKGLAGPILNSKEQRNRIRSALLVAAQHPYPPAAYIPGPAAEILLGIVSSDIRLAVRSLRDYCSALGVMFVLPESRVANKPQLAQISGSSVYIKMNAASGLCYVTLYQGRDRGVLVTLGSEQIGHLPLGLFDEEMKRADVI